MTVDELMKILIGVNKYAEISIIGNTADIDNGDCAEIESVIIERSLDSENLSLETVYLLNRSR